MEENMQKVLAGDEFSRNPMAEKLANLLVSDVDVSPMLMEGGWGIGKTVFTHRLIQKIETKEGLSRPVQCLYIDAFRSDYIEDPLFMLISSIANFLKGREERDGEWKKSVLPLAKSLLKIGGKAAFSYVFRQGLEDAGKDISLALKDSVDKGLDFAVNALIEENQKMDEHIDILKKALKKIVEDCQLIIFIDELDRCRPDFSVSLLERIKHIFDVPDVKFFLVANREQLLTSIDHIYGHGICAQRYLDKFLKFSFILSPLSSSSGSQLASFKYIEKILREKGESLEVFNDEYSKKIIRNLILINKMTLREVETFIRYLEIYNYLDRAYLVYMLNNEDVGDIFLCILAVYCVCFEKEIYKDILYGNIDFEKINSLFTGRGVEFMNEGKLIERIGNEANQILLGEESWMQLFNKINREETVFHYREKFVKCVKRITFMNS